MHVNLIKKKKPFDWLLLIIYFGVFIADLNYSALSSFYPVEANKQVQLSETIIGFVFASYSIGMFVATFVVAKLMSKRGRKKMFVILGLLFQAAGLAVFLILKSLGPNKAAYIVLSLIGRIIVGAGQGIFSAPVYSFLPILYRDTLEDKIATIEAISGFGFSVGPLFGGALYAVGGWYTPFLVNIFFSFLLVPVCFKYVPAVIKSKTAEEKASQEIIFDVRQMQQQSDELNSPNKLSDNSQLAVPTIQGTDKATYLMGSTDKESLINDLSLPQDQNLDQKNQEVKKAQAGDNEEEEEEEEEVEEMDISYGQLFSNFQIVLAYLIVVLVNGNLGFLDPTLETWVSRTYIQQQDDPEKQQKQASLITGILFFVGSLVYIIVCPLGAWLTRKCKNIKILMFIGCILSAIGMILMGPNHLLTGIKPIKSNFFILFIAQGIIGIGNMLVFIPVIPDMMDSLQRRYENIPEEVIGDLSSSLFNSSFSMGVFVGPIRILVQEFGFVKSTTFMALLIFAFCLVYGTFGKAFVLKKYKPPEKVQVAAIEEQPIIEKQKVHRRPTHQLRTYSAAGRSLRGSILHPVQDMQNSLEGNNYDLLHQATGNSRSNSIDWEIRSESKKLVSYRVRSRSRAGSTISYNFSRGVSFLNDPLIMPNTAHKQ